MVLTLPQDPDAVVDGPEEPEAVKADAETRAVAAFEAVLRDAAHIQYDHYLLYYTRKSVCIPALATADEGQITSWAGCWRARATAQGRAGTSIWSCLVSGLPVTCGRELMRWQGNRWRRLRQRGRCVSVGGCHAI